MGPYPPRGEIRAGVDRRTIAWTWTGRASACPSWPAMTGRGGPSRAIVCCGTHLSCCLRGSSRNLRGVSALKLLTSTQHHQRIGTHWPAMSAGSTAGRTGRWLRSGIGASAVTYALASGFVADDFNRGDAAESPRRGAEGLPGRNEKDNCHAMALAQRKSVRCTTAWGRVAGTSPTEFTNCRNRHVRLPLAS